MIPLETFAGAALRHWKAILAGIVLLGLSVALVVAKTDARHWRKMHEREATAHKLTVANYRAAAEKARADDLAHAAAVKARDDRIAQETQRDLQDQLASAYRAADDYARRLRAATGAGQGSTSGADLPHVAGAALDPAGTGPEAVVAQDARICAAAVVKAQGWQDWWLNVSQEAR